MVATSKLCEDRPKAEYSAPSGFPAALGSWRFPRQLSAFYRSSGVSALFKWQIECLELPEVLEETKNLIFAAPTSAGKTLVAEILMWKRLTESKRKAIYVVPFVSVGREKVIYLQRMFKVVGLKVDAYIGSQNPIAGIRSWDVAVCTVEKANNLINRCIEENTLDLVGTIVIDEFHIIGDAQRGYLVELLVTKVLQMSRVDNINIQIVAMSATISNLSSLARWMDAAYYVTDFRPVALSESLFTEGFFFDRNMGKVGALASDFTIPGDQDNIVGLCLETVVGGFGVLIFCATKHWCEKLSETIAAAFGKIIEKAVAAHLSEQLRLALNRSAVVNFLNEYKRIIGIIDPILSRTLPYAVAFHHAGLTMEEREQLERGFRAGVIRVLIATSTLSSGVNLPARRVIIRSPWGQIGATAGPCLTPGAYKQMVGRAGRQGIDTKGESVIVCKRQEVKRALDLMNATLESVESSLISKQQLVDTKNGTSIASTRLKRAVLETIVGRLSKSADEIATYVKSTLMAAEMLESGADDAEVVQKLVADCVSYLLAQEFIALDGETLIATQLGCATLASAMNPEEAWFMFEDLKQAQRSLVLDNELHMVYLATPTYMQDQWGSDFDWFRYHRLWCRLTDDERRVSKLVGVSEAFIISLSRRRGMRANGSTSNEARRHAVHMRFYTAMALYELIEETPICMVADKFGCSRGFLQALQQQASTYAGMAIAFCDRLGWWYMKTLLTGFAERIAFGVRRELTELVQIDGIDGSRARCFHHSGFTTLASLVYAKTSDITAALRKAVPFKSEADSSGASKRCWLSGHPEMTEEQAAALIQARAKSILEENLSRFGISLDKCESRIPPKEVSAPIDVIGTENGRLDSHRSNGLPPSPISESDPVDRDASVSEAENDRSAAIKETGKSILADLDDQLLESVEVDSRSPGAATPSVEEMNAINLSMTNVESANQPAQPATPAANPVPEFDDLDRISMNMSRISITPHSNNGEVTPAASAPCAEPSSRKSFDLKLTESQFSRIFNESMSASPVWRNARRIEDEAKPVIDSAIDSRDGLITRKLSNGTFICQALPVALSKKDAAAILGRTSADDDYILDAGDIDLFDDNWPADQGDSSDGVVDEDGRGDGLSSPAIPELDSGIETTASSQLDASVQQNTPAEFHTPVLPSRKRQRPLRSNSDCSTPSPLIRKCSKRDVLDSERAEMAQDGLEMTQRPRQHLPIEIGGDQEVIVVNVCSSFETFSKFASDWRAQKCFAIAFAKRRSTNGQQSSKVAEMGPSVGDSVDGSGRAKKEIVGVAICWTLGAVYYLPLEDDTLTESSKDRKLESAAVTRKERIRLLKRCLCAKAAEESQKVVFDYLRQQNLIRNLLADSITGSVHCLLVADWLLTCGSDDTPPVKSVENLINRYSSSFRPTFPNYLRGGALEIFAEAVSIFSAWPRIERQLKQRRLLTAFIETEMPAIKVVSEMEASGIGFDLPKCRDACSKVKELSEDLERRAYELAGRTFSLTSYLDLAKVLFVELKLPANGASTALRSRQNEGTRRHYSTSKEVLEKLRSLHVLPAVILDWRKLQTALTSAIFPLLKGASNSEERGKRVFGTYDWYTATGRVIMHEPSLQVMPRSFDITNAGGGSETLSVRNLITAEPGYVLLSADYSQLELRVFAHLSEDDKLLEILNSDDGDVFRIIASAWLGLPPEKVDSEQRQRAKKLCYGVIYGMGAKTLAEELEVSEETATGFMDAFKLQFPGVFRWMEEVVTTTRENGYVKTLSGRIRYLPSIRFTTRSLLDQRLQAERQAVNTSVQGSAADIFKSALRDVSNVLQKRYSTNDSRGRGILAAEPSSAGLTAGLSMSVALEPAYRFVLQLHDEMILETKESIVDQVAEIVRRQMEQCYRLRVQLRVRLAVGKTWGDLKPVQL